MDTIYKVLFDGVVKDAVNVELHNGLITPITPKRNAVIVDFVNDEKIVTIECKDDNLYEQMKAYANFVVLTK